MADYATNRANSAVNGVILSFLDIDAPLCISIGGNSIAVLCPSPRGSGRPISPRAVYVGATFSPWGTNLEKENECFCTSQTRNRRG